MPNKHLEHIEDSIFDGRRAALYAIKEALSAQDNISVKYDGAPAIVFGTNPDNGRFFVGTKSVFNKKKVLINYSHEDIDKNHKGNVADILRLCLRYLPRIPNIVQADWIGCGGGSVYTPNTCTYKFDAPIHQQIILAPHTQYDEVSPNAVGHLGVYLPSTSDCRFIDTNTAKVSNFKSYDLLLQIAATIPFAKIPKNRVEICKHVNRFIRAGSAPSAEVIYTTLPDKYKEEVNVNTFKVWHLISALKMRLLDSIVDYSNVKSFIGDTPVKHEGFVILSDNPYKIVDRNTFSKANFNLDKNWTNEKV
jgi:hypothetical protein